MLLLLLLLAFAVAACRFDVTVLLLLYLSPYAVSFLFVVCFFIFFFFFCFSSFVAIWVSLRWTIRHRSSSSSSSIFLYRSASQTAEAVDLLHNKTRRCRNTGLKNTYLPSECSDPAILRSIVLQEDDSRLFDRRSFPFVSFGSTLLLVHFLSTSCAFKFHLEEITIFFFIE